jgi:hypothetical protein
MPTEKHAKHHETARDSSTQRISLSFGTSTTPRDSDPREPKTPWERFDRRAAQPGLQLFLFIYQVPTISGELQVGDSVMVSVERRVLIAPPLRYWMLASIV